MEDRTHKLVIEQRRALEHGWIHLQAMTRAELFRAITAELGSAAPKGDGYARIFL